ncbi:helix-turn-helix transcriptional regulator [Sporosarcina sp. A2]|uniref:helix-turn-helix transcriptional regulator n=1 Tax=Sporosarcina sp. A2 TaxID=3393449 RepID=UPI003D79B175
MKQWNLIRLRSDRGLKQKDMAKMLGVTDETYGMKERGQHQFQMDEMFVISHFFHVPIEDIFLPRNIGITEVREQARNTQTIK